MTIRPGISKWFIQRPVATTLLTAAVALLGVFAFPLLPIAPLPEAGCVKFAPGSTIRPPTVTGAVGVNVPLRSATTWPASAAQSLVPWPSALRLVTGTRWITISWLASWRAVSVASTRRRTSGPERGVKSRLACAVMVGAEPPF